MDFEKRIKCRRCYKSDFYLIVIKACIGWSFIEFAQSLCICLRLGHAEAKKIAHVWHYTNGGSGNAVNDIGKRTLCESIA